MKSLHQVFREMGPRGAYVLICVTLALWFSAFALYRVLNDPLGTLPGQTINKTVPATGEQGYPVEPFCNDPLTKVSRLSFVPPDSQFAAIYILDRTEGGIHEVVTVRSYADKAREPVGTYQDDIHPAYVNPAAMKCILKRVQ